MKGAGRWVVGLAVAALLVLAGCTTIRGLIDTEEALERAGFTEVDVGFSSEGDFDQLDVTLRPPSLETDPEASLEEASRVVWTTFPLRFDLVRVELVGGAIEGTSATYTYSEMVEIYGPRSPDLDEKDLGDDVVRAGLGIAIVLVVGGVIFVTAVVLTIVLGVRASRRRAAATPPAWPPVPKPGA